MNTQLSAKKENRIVLITILIILVLFILAPFIVLTIINPAEKSREAQQKASQSNP